jgi:hypothetical protein
MEEAQARELRWRPVIAALASAILIVTGGLVAAVALADRTPVEPLAGPVAVGVLLAAPGVVGLLGLRDRPDLWLAAALGAFLTSLMASVLIVVVLPAGVALAFCWLRQASGTRRSVVHPLVVAVVVQILLVAAAAALFLSEDPRTWEDHDSTGSTQDIITNTEAGLSLTGVALAVAAAWVLSRPQRAERSGPLASAGPSTPSGDN